jgi:anti-anti-sigma factor
MTTALTVTTRTLDDGSPVVSAEGEIDLSNVTSFARALDSAIEGASTRVRVDLSAIDYLDSGAINVLFGHCDHIQVVANPVLMPVLTVSGLPELVDVRPSG